MQLVRPVGNDPCVVPLGGLDDGGLIAMVVYIFFVRLG